jgi:hypothetical protein
MRLVPLCLTALAVCAAPAAQSFTVSPPQYAEYHGTDGNTFPWNNLFRYQQIDAHLGSMPRVLRGLAWRHDTNGNWAARTLEVEVLMANSSLAAASATFAANYAAPAQVVFVRKNVNTPAWSIPVRALPTPFDFALLHDVPFVHTGQADLLWEVVITNTSMATTFGCNAASSSATTNPGSYTMNGTGCTTPNGSYELRSSITTSRTSNAVTFTWNARSAPGGAASALLLSIVDPDALLPGLCGRLRAISLLQINGTTSNTGAWTPTAGSLPLDPSWVGLALFAQAVSADPTQGGIPVALSNGVRSRIGDVPQPVNMARIYANGTPTATSGSVTRNFGLVTRYMH